MKSRGKRDTAWNIPSSITFSPLHFMLHRGKPITFVTVYTTYCSLKKQIIFFFLGGAEDKDHDYWLAQPADQSELICTVFFSYDEGSISLYKGKYFLQAREKNIYSSNISKTFFFHEEFLPRWRKLSRHIQYRDSKCREKLLKLISNVRSD